MPWVYRPGHPQANENGMVDKAIATPLVDRDSAPYVIGDINPYRAIAADVDGKAPVIGGRRQHREFLKRNGYQEIGNEWTPLKKTELPTSDRITDIRRAMGDY